MLLAAVIEQIYILNILWVIFNSFTVFFASRFGNFSVGFAAFTDSSFKSFSSLFNFTRALRPLDVFTSPNTVCYPFVAPPLAVRCMAS